MNNKDIETLSVNAVRECITITDHLEQSISDNDKEPSWDGSIIIYGNKKGDKSKILGKVPVQVKGKRESKQSKNEISYKMKVSDLRNYLIDGGCFLFMVYINPNNMKKKIYYNALTPIKLERILDNVVMQKTKSIKLKKFPTNNNKKENILLNFHNDCKRQTSFSRNNYIEIEEVGKINSIEEIIMPIASIAKPVSYQMLLDSEIYFYAKFKDNSSLIPVNALPKINAISNYIDCNISIDDKTYYEKMRIVRKIDGVTLCIGESLKLIFKDNEDEFKISYESPDTARVVVKDLEFSLKILEAGYFKINDEEITIDKDKIIYDKFNVDEARQDLELSKDVVTCLDKLKCEEDIYFGELKEQDWAHLNILINAFVYNKNIKGLGIMKSIIKYIYVGKLKFFLYFKQVDSKDEYKIYNFFDVHLPSEYSDKSSKIESFDVSQFVILSKQDFITCNNIDFNKILLDFKNTEHNDETFSTANYYLLELLTAADITEGKRKEKILKACEDFALWIKEAPDEELEDEIKTINLLQVYKRQRNLTDEENDELHEIVVNNSDNPQYMVGAYLLLGQQRQAERYFNKMSKEDQDDFKKYPIYQFWEQ